MKRKRWFAVAAVIAALAAALLPVPALVSVLAPRPRINREVFARIEIGMTEKEVEAVLGAPPGDYRTGPGADAAIWVPLSSLAEPPPESVLWVGDNGLIVTERHGGLVCWKEFEDLRSIKQTPFESLLWHYRNGWRMLFGP